MKLNIENHPCFNDKVRHTHSRIHLPVAPRCNIQCKYCNRNFDCVNESRPGVSSTLLNPIQALSYVQKMMDMDMNISVVGIAGPGDPFANPDETMETMRIIREAYPEMLICVSSNGLAVEPYVDELARLKVSHVTITINAIDPEISSQIYSWVRFRKRIYHGIEGARILLDQQIKTIKALKKADITVKVNTVVVPGMNDHHIEELSKKMAELGADIQNCIPVYPVAGTAFADIKKMPGKEIHELRATAGTYLPQMSHCARCRADAVGLIGQTISKEVVEALKDAACSNPVKETNRPYVAVGSLEGILVNQHLGDAKSLLIYEKNGEDYHLIETRVNPEPGSGDQRWIDLGNKLKDCRTILVSGAGSKPVSILKAMDISVEIMDGLIEEGLEAVFAGKPVRSPIREQKCGVGCTGNGTGCG